MSEKLSIFLKNNINPIIKNDFQKTRFSNNCKKFLEILFNQITFANENFKKTNIKTQKLCKNMNCDDFPKGNNYEYMPNEIKSNILNMEKSVYLSQININGKLINIHLICKKNKTNNFINNITKKIYLWLSIALQYSPKRCSHNLDIYLYFTDLEKKLPKHGETIKEINANTAFTTFCKPSTEIILFREEEWFKVLIHESFHAFSLDFSNMPNGLISAADQNVRKIFPLNIDLRYYETYCEMWAEVIQIIWLSRTELSENHFTENHFTSFESFERMVKKDQTHSIKQAVKVLRHYHMTYMDLFEKTAVAQIKRRGYREITPVMSYYIIKSIFYTHIDIYIEWTTVQNRGSLNFRKTKENLDSYVDLLTEIYNSGKCLKLMNSVTTQPGGEDNHLRMSVHG